MKTSIEASSRTTIAQILNSLNRRDPAEKALVRREKITVNIRRHPEDPAGPRTEHNQQNSRREQRRDHRRKGVVEKKGQRLGRIIRQLWKMRPEIQTDNYPQYPG